MATNQNAPRKAHKTSASLSESDNTVNNQPQVAEQQVLSEQAVLDMLGISKKSLRRLCQEGWLAYSRIGTKHFFYQMKDILAMLNHPDIRYNAFNIKESC